jgi:hypothetical protein
MIHTRAVDCPAGGRSVFSAYDVYAIDIQRKQTKRVPFSCGQKMALCVRKNKFFAFLIIKSLTQLLFASFPNNTHTAPLHSHLP